MVRRTALLLALATASLARASSLSIEGGAVALGRTESSKVLIRVDEPPGTEDLPLRLSVNVGSFSEPVRLGPGRFRAVYTPPPTRFPQLAIAALWRETGPDARIDFLSFPLFGLTRVPVSARPGAEVAVKVGPDRFGPVVADARGRAEVPIMVEPGVARCEVSVRERRGGEVTKQVPLEVPDYNRLTVALVPHAVVADGKSPVRLDVFYDLGGSDLAPERIRVTPSAGRVTFQRGSRGLYTYRYVPPADLAAASVSFAVSVAGDPMAQAFAQLSIGLPAPARVLVAAPAQGLRAGSGASVPVKVLVLDAAGMGLPGMDVSGRANGRSLPAPAYRGGGLYEFHLEAPAVHPPGGLVHVEATVTSGGKSLAGTVNWQLEAAPVPGSIQSRFHPSPVPADGRTQARLVLDVRDGAGAPLEHAQLLAVASHGTLGKVVERGGGTYEQAYVAPPSLPDGEATLRLVDGSGGFERSLPIPLRQDPCRLLLGIGGGYTRSPGDASGLRAGAEMWAPFRLGEATFGAGVAASYGTASRTVSDPAGSLRSLTEAAFVPVTLKVGYEAYAARRLSLTVGAGATLAWARMESSLAAGSQQGLGAGWLGFLDLGWGLGRGQALLGISYGSSVVETADYRIDPGGLSVVTGYRLGLF